MSTAPVGPADSATADGAPVGPADSATEGPPSDGPVAHAPATRKLERSPGAALMPGRAWLAG